MLNKYNVTVTPNWDAIKEENGGANPFEGLAEILHGMNPYVLSKPNLPLESFTIYTNGDTSKVSKMPNPEFKEYQEWLTESYPWPVEELYLNERGEAYGMKNPHNLPRVEFLATFGTGKDHKGMRHIAGTRAKSKRGDAAEFEEALRELTTA